MGKGEIARYEQFLLSPSVFKRLLSQGRQKVSLVGNGLNKRNFLKNCGLLPSRNKQTAVAVDKRTCKSFIVERQPSPTMRKYSGKKRKCW